MHKDNTESNPHQPQSRAAALLVLAISLVTVVVILVFHKDRPVPGWFGMVGWHGPQVRLSQIGFPDDQTLKSMLNQSESEIRSKCTPELAGYLLAFRSFEKGDLEAKVDSRLMSHGTPYNRLSTDWNSEELAFFATAFDLSYNASKPLEEKTAGEIGEIIRRARPSASFAPLTTCIIVHARLIDVDYSFAREAYSDLAEKFPHNRYILLAYSQLCSSGGTTNQNFGKDGHVNIDEPGFEFRKAISVAENIRAEWPDFADNLLNLCALYNMFEYGDKACKAAKEFLECQGTSPKERKFVQGIIERWTSKA